jgi:hypothetical protein
MEPEQFLDLLQTEIDIGMQVSLTETFNVVCADYVTAGVPVVASKEVVWLSSLSKALDNDVSDMIDVMDRAYHGNLLPKWNQHLLAHYSAQAQRMWASFCLSQK